jgi:hypothetical protein
MQRENRRFAIICRTMRKWSALLLAAFLSAGLSAASAAAAPPLEGLQPKELTADQVWTMRAGLNVAALQCQFSPFLMMASYYNSILRQHSDEFTDAFNTMNRYFERIKGKKIGPRAFDTYATRSNQSFATFDAQYAFCDAAAALARKALAVRKGQFGAFSAANLPELRASLTNTAQFVSLRQMDWTGFPPPVPPLCSKGRRCR